jgi:hypothetical protein
MVNEQQATAKGAATNANCLGAAGLQLIAKLSASDVAILPIFDVWPFFAINWHIRPVTWQLHELRQ